MCNYREVDDQVDIILFKNTLPEEKHVATVITHHSDGLITTLYFFEDTSARTLLTEVKWHKSIEITKKHVEVTLGKVCEKYSNLASVLEDMSKGNKTERILTPSGVTIMDIVHPRHCCTDCFDY